MEKLLVKNNPLFNRKEVELRLESNISPNMQDAETAIAQEFSSNPESIKIKQIKGKFGSREFIIKANIYSSKEDKDKTEPKSKKDKKAEAKPEGGSQ